MSATTPAPDSASPGLTPSTRPPGVGRTDAAAAVQQLIEAEVGATPEVRAYYLSHRHRYTALVHVLDSLPLPPGSSVLELGCAEGILSGFLRDRYGWAPTGLEYFPHAVAKVQARGIPAHVCDIDRTPLPVPDHRFQLVLFDSLLEHMYGPARVLAEIRRVLAPGGYLLLGTPNATGMVARLKTLAGRNPFAFFNQFNAIENQAFMRLCAVFYTPAEVMTALGPSFHLELLRYAALFAPDRAQRSLARNLVTPARLALYRLVPAWSDFFYLIARHDPAPSTPPLRS